MNAHVGCCIHAHITYYFLSCTYQMLCSYIYEMLSFYYSGCCIHACSTWYIEVCIWTMLLFNVIFTHTIIATCMAICDMPYYGKSQGTTSLHHRIPHARQLSDASWCIHAYTRCSIHAYWMVRKCIDSMLYKCMYWMLYWCTYRMLYSYMPVEFYSFNLSAFVASFMHI